MTQFTSTVLHLSIKKHMFVRHSHMCKRIQTVNL